MNRKDMTRMMKKVLLLAAAAAGALTLTACSYLSRTETGTQGGQNVSGSAGTQEGSGEVSADGTQGSGTSGSTVQPDYAQDEPVGDVIPDEDADAAERENADDWSGTYVTDTESVTVTLLDEHTLSFAFAQSGISGTAEVDGTQAVFKGDDYHVVVFSLQDTVLEIAVSSEEDFDASDSPLNGTFIRCAE